MTDAELNRTVAEARGWTQITEVPAMAQWRGLSPSGGAGPLPDVCSDPAAWGALFEELAADGWNITVSTDAHGTLFGLLRWLPGPVKQYGLVRDPSVGRAFAKAFLASKGIL